MSIFDLNVLYMIPTHILLNQSKEEGDWSEEAKIVMPYIYAQQMNVQAMKFICPFSFVNARINTHMKSVFRNST